MLFRNTFRVPVGILVNLLLIVDSSSATEGSKDFKGLKYLGSYRNVGQDSKDSDYFYSFNPTTWNAAETDCIDRFGRGGLLWVETPEELDFVAESVAAFNHTFEDHWTDGVYSTSRKAWLWLSTGELVPTWIEEPVNPDSDTRLIFVVLNRLNISLRRTQELSLKHTFVK